jgi:putative DNA primase/helicase
MRPLNTNDIQNIRQLKNEYLPEGDEMEKEEWPEPEPIIASLLPVEKFSTELIPEPFRPWVRDVAYRMQCPLEFTAMGAVIMASAVIGAGCGIRPKRRDDWLVVPNLWGGVIGRVGGLKTPALTEILKPLAALEAKAKREHGTGLKEYQVDKEISKINKEALKSEMLRLARGKKNLDELKCQYMAIEEPQIPRCKRFKTHDSTVEKMGELLSENPRGILLFRDELIGLLTSWEREGRESDRAFYLETRNGYGNFTSDRIGRGSIFCDNLCVSILGGIQPAKLLSYFFQAANDFENDGLIQRMQLLVYPDDNKEWDLIDEYPDSQARKRIFYVIEKLAEMDFTSYGAQLDEGNKIPYLHFKDDAQELFYSWLSELERVKLRKDEPPYLLEHLSKYRSLMPSLAHIDHLINVADGKDEGDVSLSATERAAGWCEVLESHARRIYALIGDVNQRAAAALAEKIQKGKLQDGFTIRDIYHQKHWHLLSKKEVVVEACAELIDAGWLKQEELEIPGRQPKIIHRINPKIFPLNA